MAADRNRVRPGRVGAAAAALGVGAVIACSTAGPASATDDDTNAPASGSSSQVDAPTTDHEAPPAADARDDTEDTEDAEDTEDVEDAEDTEDAETDDAPDEESGTGPSGEDEPSGEPVPVARTIDDTVLDDHEATPAPEDSDPEGPGATAALLTLAGSARRDDDLDDEPAPATSAPTSQLHEPETPAHAPEVGSPQDEPEPEPLYTGRPSFIHQVVTFGLTVLKAVLKPFGGLLSFTSLKIPFFTDGVPPFFLTGGLKVELTEFEGMKVWSLTPRREATDTVVVALHGGAYVATASIFHWWTYADMARDTGATVVVPLQTLVPGGGTAASEVPRTANFITTMIDGHGAENVSVLGDSAGGGLALAAMQELVRRGSRNPSRLVLLAPWLDVSMSDPRSAEIEDPLLDIPNLARSGARWAGGAQNTANPLASPLFGPLAGLPPTYVYSSSLDLLTVDTLRLRDRVLAAGIPNVTFRLRDGLIHDWATFPFLPDAHEDRPRIYADLLGPVMSPSVV
ncbi:alpha/beta hydrolase fold domain-containing protein [Mycobacterium sp. NAZ190054]|uniref:alpha/beta hydrolase fold domain-containing protein n=1 Tax=Mycobacterium sp. NAZ190054 TaxID=1747766 RepID=UPI000796F0BE|nr:alpha/beta hydrolase fold domain-containing protein [Mycobacterium sp. NAZ190054]KWX67235.1 alpha/beta hydrolase [Mycobacterium sp. NAZ190054]